MRTWIAVALGMMLVPIAPLKAEQLTSRGPVVTVRGEGRAQVAPDYARLVVQVTSRAATLEAVAATHRERATKATAALRAALAAGDQIGGLKPLP